jgi:hypothetical protein
MNSLWDIHIFLGLVPKESPSTTLLPKKFLHMTYKLTAKKKAIYIVNLKNSHFFFLPWPFIKYKLIV